MSKNFFGLIITSEGRFGCATTPDRLTVMNSTWDNLTETTIVWMKNTSYKCNECEKVLAIETDSVKIYMPSGYVIFPRGINGIGDATFTLHKSSCFGGMIGPVCEITVHRKFNIKNMQPKIAIQAFAFEPNLHGLFEITSIGLGDSMIIKTCRQLWLQKMFSTDFHNKIMNDGVNLSFEDGWTKGLPYDLCCKLDLFSVSSKIIESTVNWIESAKRFHNLGRHHVALCTHVKNLISVFSDCYISGPNSELGSIKCEMPHTQQLIGEFNRKQHTCDIVPILNVLAGDFVTNLRESKLYKMFSKIRKRSISTEGSSES